MAIEDRVMYERHLAKHDAEVRRGVLEQGVIARTTSAGEHFSDSYSHTIGLTRFRLPEVVLCGFVPPLGEVLVRNVGAAMVSARWTVSGSVPDVCDGRVVEAVVDPGRGQSAVFKFSLTGRAGVDVELADRFYMRKVPFVFGVTAGWPCQACAGVSGVACSCEFSCWHVGCRFSADG